MHALEVQDRRWAKSKPLEDERISQIEMQITVSKGHTTELQRNLNPIQIHNQAIQAVVHLLSK